jgi:integration host factor subunit beta
VTKRGLIDELVALYPRFSRRDAEVMVNAVFESLSDALRRGERIEIRGFGSFVVKQREARDGRNPRTGKRVAVAAKRVPLRSAGLRARRRRG